MKKLLKHMLILSLLSLICLPSALAIEKDPGNYLMAPMPLWYQEGFALGHLDIDRMVKDGYSRLEALEIQNQMKDILEKDPEYMKWEEGGKTGSMLIEKHARILKALKQAVINVKEKKQIESGFTPAPLQNQEFYVAFDMDETLLVQWYSLGKKGSGYYDLKVSRVDSIIRPAFYSPDYVSLTPGWEKALMDIAAIPGCKGIVLFTAKEDQAAQDIVERLQLNGKPIRQFVKGVFTRNYLIRSGKALKLSKDLRVIDESLQHVVLIDDNPSRILQSQLPNLREFPKYNADEYLEAKNENKNPQMIAYYEKLLPVIVEEIREAAQYARKNNTTFETAYYPYSMDASAELLMLVKQGYSFEDAYHLLRTQRSMFEPQFFFFKKP